MEATVARGEPQEHLNSGIQNIQFSDGNGEWQAIPRWAAFLIRLGYSWPDRESSDRRIGLISLPCDSAAAGLIVLGAIRQRLEHPNADDLASHFLRICDLARVGGPSFRLFDVRKRGRERGPYVVVGQDAAIGAWVSLQSAPATRVFISLATAASWQVDGEPPIQLVPGNRMPFGAHFAELIEEAGSIESANFLRSDSQICLAGRAIGEAGTRDAFSSIRFRAEDAIVGLPALTTVYKWSPGTVSRVSFFNSRTDEIDRRTRPPRLVVADGDKSFLKVLKQKEFLNSDVLGVVHRTIDRDRLEQLGAALTELDQWYESDQDVSRSMPACPRGISLAVLKRKQ